MVDLGLLNNLKILEIYPPFLFMGAKIKSISKDGRELHARLPLRWYTQNIHGTMFGGFLCALADPLPAIMCARLLPDVDVWTKTNMVDFVVPARGTVDLKIAITQKDMSTIRKALRTKSKALHRFDFAYTDRTGTIIAHVQNTVYFRMKRGVKRSRA
jgi:acyl-coenzyme A thioesterase PaaI-like protein